MGKITAMHEGAPVSIDFSLVPNTDDTVEVEVLITDAKIHTSPKGAIGIIFKAETRTDIVGVSKGFLNSYIYLGNQSDPAPKWLFGQLATALGLQPTLTNSKQLATEMNKKPLKMAIKFDNVNAYEKDGVKKYSINYGVKSIHATDHPTIGEKIDDTGLPEFNWNAL